MSKFGKISLVKEIDYGSVYKHLALKGALGEPIAPTLLA